MFLVSLPSIRNELCNMYDDYISKKRGYNGITNSAKKATMTLVTPLVGCFSLTKFNEMYSTHCVHEYNMKSLQQAIESKIPFNSAPYSH